MFNTSFYNFFYSGHNTEIVYERRFEAVAEAAKVAGLPVRGYVSCVCGCPYEGAVDPQKVAQVNSAANAVKKDILHLLMMYWNLEKYFIRQCIFCFNELDSN